MCGEKGDIVRFFLDFQYLFLNRRAKEDAPRQEPAERRIQRESDLGLAHSRDVPREEVTVQCGLVGPGQV